MIGIEDNGILKFYNGTIEITSKDGFARLNELYRNEPPEVKKVIDRLKKKYERASYS